MWKKIPFSTIYIYKSITNELSPEVWKIRFQKQHRGFLYNLGYRKLFLYNAQNGQIMKRKICKGNYIKNKNFYPQKPSWN